MPMFTDSYRTDLEGYDYCGDDYDQESTPNPCQDFWETHILNQHYMDLLMECSISEACQELTG